MKPNNDLKAKEPLLQNKDWRLWCRLCAKVNMQNCINVFFKNEEACSEFENLNWNSDGGVNRLATEIGRFFWVNMTSDDNLPQSICNECNSLIETLINFSERVARVNKMFDSLQNSFDVAKNDLNEVRLKYGLSNIEDDVLPTMAEVILVEEKPSIRSESGSGENQRELTIDVNPLATKSPTGHIKSEEETDDDDENVECEPLINAVDDDLPKSNEDPIETDNDEDSIRATLPLIIKPTGKEKKSVYECTECHRKFKYGSHFETHMKRIHGKEVQVEGEKKVVPCPHCEKKFKTKFQLKLHINNIHKTERPYICIECGYATSSRSTLRNHRLTHSDYAPYECDICKKGFKTKYNLELHKETHDSHKHICPECGLELNSRATLNRHLLLHSKRKLGGLKDKSKIRFECSICHSKFQNTNHFEQHMKRVHKQNVQIDEENKIAPCPFCDMKFKTKWFLDSHINNIHKRERIFICEECGVTTRTSGALSSHMLTHTDYAPFECGVCKKSFKTEYRLRVHKEIHDPNKHICSECGLQLNSRVTLNRHLLIHSDKMDHKCDYCGRAFKRAKTLKTHLLGHTGLKPYTCDFCDRTFANGSNCRTHKKKSHPVELAAQEASGEKTCTQNIPNLAALKAITKNNDNLTPVVSKQSGNFAFGKKPKPMEKNANANLVEDNSQTVTLEEKLSLQVFFT